MKPDWKKTLLCVAACTVSALFLGAQTGVDAGFSTGGRGAGLTADIYRKNSPEFTSVTVVADLHGVVTGKDINPGIRANMIHNFIISSKDLDGGGKYLFYGGPGITAGYTRDNGMDFGPVAALSGRLGMSFLFNRITVSLGVTADLGLHLLINNQFTDKELSLYKDGIYHAFVPEMRLMVPMGKRSCGNGKNLTGRPSKAVFSVEQGILTTFFERYDNSYLNSDRARNSYSGDRWSDHINSMMLISFGYAFTDRFLVRMSTGYAGMHDDARDIPLTAGAAFFPQGRNCSGFQIFADGGLGLAGSSSRSNDFLSRAGGGWRFTLGGGKKSLDLNLYGICAYYKPDKITSKYSGEIITGKDILDSGSWLAGIGFSIAFNL